MKAKYTLIVSYFYILLFVYAAISKLITFEAFQVQLTQSPLLSAYANAIAYLVLIVELLFALLLSIRTTRLLGLYLSYGLMVAFTIYIYLIINHSDFIPCSCGGVLEKMGWTEHLWFNIIVSLLALVALFFKEHNTKRYYLLSFLITITSSLLVVLLFLSSEYIIKKENPFIRRYLPHGVVVDQTIDLQVNSFYFSGHHHDTLYLGNYTAPLLMLEIDPELNKKARSISIDSLHLGYKYLKLKTFYPHFYLADGFQSTIYQGRLDHKSNPIPTKLVSYKQIYFSDYLPVDSINLIFKAQHAESMRIVLGRIKLVDENYITIYTSLLEQKGDGVFDTDGIISYSKEHQQLIYTYYYKNQFLQLDNRLKLLSKQNTIDTTKTTVITSAKLSTGENKMTTPVRAINSKVIAHRNLLFIISNSMGQNESKQMWKQASIVDVYDFVSNSYVGSFYINHLGEDKLSDFIVTNHYLYGLFDKQLVRYQLAKSITSKFQ